MKDILQYLFNHQTLSRTEAKSILAEISLGKYNETEVTSFISVFLMRSITLPELQGFREALLSLAKPLHLKYSGLVDIVGTGGDGKNTFNISTLASFVVAGTGQKVCKQGNYGATATSGASNVLEVLGYHFTDDEEVLNSQLETANICFLHAPLFHPALKSVAPMRKQLGLRTFFNLLGPLVNPAQPQFPVIGVASLEIARAYLYLLQQTPLHFTLIHALDGYDEISLTGDTKIMNRHGESICSAAGFGYKSVDADAICGIDSPEQAAQIFMNILSGHGTEAQNSVVLANAATALQSTGKYGGYDHCLELCKESLFSGHALKSLKIVTANHAQNLI